MNANITVLRRVTGSFGAAEESEEWGHISEDPDLTDCLVSGNKREKKTESEGCLASNLLFIRK